MPRHILGTRQIRQLPAFTGAVALLAVLCFFGYWSGALLLRATMQIVRRMTHPDLCCDANEVPVYGKVLWRVRLSAQRWNDLLTNSEWNPCFQLERFFQLQTKHAIVVAGSFLVLLAVAYAVALRWHLRRFGFRSLDPETIDFTPTTSTLLRFVLRSSASAFLVGCATVLMAFLVFSVASILLLSWLTTALTAVSSRHDFIAAIASCLFVGTCMIQLARCVALFAHRTSKSRCRHCGYALVRIHQRCSECGQANSRSPRARQTKKLRLICCRSSGWHWSVLFLLPCAVASMLFQPHLQEWRGQFGDMSNTNKPSASQTDVDIAMLRWTPDFTAEACVNVQYEGKINGENFLLRILRQNEDDAMVVILKSQGGDSPTTRVFRRWDPQRQAYSNAFVPIIRVRDCLLHFVPASDIILDQGVNRVNIRVYAKDFSIAARRGPNQ